MRINSPPTQQEPPDRNDDPMHTDHTDVDADTHYDICVATYSDVISANSGIYFATYSDMQSDADCDINPDKHDL